MPRRPAEINNRGRLHCREGNARTPPAPEFSRTAQVTTRGKGGGSLSASPPPPLFTWARPPFAGRWGGEVSVGRSAGRSARGGRSSPQPGARGEARRSEAKQGKARRPAQGLRRGMTRSWQPCSCAAGRAVLRA